MSRFDLCGMGVDLLRSCYRTKMRLRSDSTEETDIQWFFCLPGALPYPGYTLFASGNWAFNKFGWQGPGEVEGAERKWVNGRPPKVGMLGQGFCGPHYALEHGANAVDHPPLPLFRDGTAKCCPRPTAEVGGDAVGGQVRTRLHVSCGPCTSISKSYTLTCPAIGTVSMEYIGFCQWKSATVPSPCVHDFLGNPQPVFAVFGLDSLLGATVTIFWDTIFFPIFGEFSLPATDWDCDLGGALPGTYITNPGGLVVTLSGVASVREP